MAKKRVLQFRIASWFWIVLVVATFFFGRSWDETWESLWRQKPASAVGAGPNSGSATTSVTIPGMGPAPLSIDLARQIPSSTELDERKSSFFIGISR
jgi:hypothetical protein